MQQIYTVGIYFFSFLVKVYAFFNGKSKKIIKGQRATWKILENQGSESYIWFHVASLGEFEQGRPLIETLKTSYPQQKILITFFSPSGYEVKKNYSHADLVLYLPFDTPSNSKRFLSKISIKVAVFVKYEFWFNYLNRAQSIGIPIIYVSSLFRKEQIYFKSKWMLNIFKKVNHFFVQNQESMLILNNYGLNNVSVAGDTRIDSVLLTAGKSWHNPSIEKVLNGKPLIVFGSTWKGDYKLIASFINENSEKYQYIIAPHEVNQNELLELESDVKLKVSYYSDSEDFSNVLIINTIGVLKYLYRYADVAYIGGGFNNGIHNTLEPLAYNIPVLFGPKNHAKFTEARDIIGLGMGALVNSNDFHQKLEFYLNSLESRTEVERKIKKYIENNKGATSKIVDYFKHLM